MKLVVRPAPVLRGPLVQYLSADDLVSSCGQGSVFSSSNATADRPTSSKTAFDHEPVISVHTDICARTCWFVKQAAFCTCTSVSLLPFLQQHYL